MSEACGADGRFRYCRNTLLPGVGEVGQEKLAKGRVLIIGAGGLGSPAALYLAAAGVGTIGIMDRDLVDESNLQRQILHATGDIGRRKVMSAAETLRGLNPGISIVPYAENFTAENALVRLAGYDIALDCTDGFTEKFLINDACVVADKPFVHAGVTGFSGQVMTVIPHKSACYRCVFEAPPPEGSVFTCSQTGVLGPVAGVIGALQATEALKYLLGLGDLLTNALFTLDGLSMQSRKVALHPNSDCAVCGAHPAITTPHTEYPAHL